MDDLIFRENATLIQFANAPHGATVFFECEGCSMTYWMTNKQLNALAEWLSRRAPQSDG